MGFESNKVEVFIPREAVEKRIAELGKEITAAYQGKSLTLVGIMKGSIFFLTDLRPHDIVFGKLAVTSLATFYRFLAIVPVLGLPMLLGGDRKSVV